MAAGGKWTSLPRCFSTGDEEVAPVKILWVPLFVLGLGLPAVAGEPVRVVPEDVVPNARQPQAAVGEDGTIHLACGAGETIYYTASHDGGRNYPRPVQVDRLPRLALGLRRGPRIAATQHGVVITAAAHGEGGGLFAWRSTDGGRTWQGPVRIDDTGSNTAGEGLHAMAAGPHGDVYCVWLDHRGGRGNNLYGARSTDGGQTWSENRLIYRSPSGGICPCCHPAVTYDSNGDLYMMWRNAVNGFRDMYVSVSRDGGRTFGEVEKLGRGHWKLDRCPMDGGYLATTEPGQVTTVWRRKDQVFRTDGGTDREQRLGRGEQPWVAGTPDGAYCVWISRRGGDLWLASPESPHPRKLAGEAVDPVVAAPVTGTGPVVVVWQVGQGKNKSSAIMSAVVHE